MNLYGMVGNDAVNLWDYLGLVLNWDQDGIPRDLQSKMRFTHGRFKVECGGEVDIRIEKTPEQTGVAMSMLYIYQIDEKTGQGPCCCDAVLFYQKIKTNDPHPNAEKMGAQPNKPYWDNDENSADSPYGGARTYTGEVPTIMDGGVPGPVQPPGFGEPKIPNAHEGIFDIPMRIGKTPTMWVARTTLVCISGIGAEKTKKTIAEFEWGFERFFDSDGDFRVRIIGPKQIK